MDPIDLDNYANGATSYNVKTGGLPPGVTLVDSIISGTPTEPGIQVSTVFSATNANGFADTDPQNIMVV